MKSRSRASSTMSKLLALFLSLVIVAFSATAQDLHFTNYSASPQNINPALTGDFSGTYKVGGIYRDQFSKFFSKGYQSQGGFLEYNLPLRVGGENWLSAGAFFDNDVAGDLAFGSTRMGLNLAYHLSLSRRKFNALSIGVQGAFINRKTENQNFITEESLLGTPAVENVSNLLDSYNAKRFDFSIGILHTMDLSKKASSRIGVSLYHFIASNIATGSLAQDYIPLRLNVHGELQFRLQNNFTLKPRLYFSTAEEASELAAQLLLAVPLGKNNIELGVGHRFNDAVQFILGLDFRGWIIQGSFDLTVSSAKVYNDNIGGFEIGAYKIITLYPKTKVKNLLICPRL